MHKRWRARGPHHDAAEPDSLAQALQTHPLIARLLLNRGLHEPEAARQFLEPRLSDLHEPTLMSGLAQAARRIARAVDERQPIIIYGDYDVDGVTASAILWHLLRAMDAQPAVYIPHRIDEGYGLNCEALEHFAALELAAESDRFAVAPPAPLERQPLVISVDCGITAHQAAATAKRLGLELIVTDHHQFDPASLPPAAALVHPRLPDEAGEGYPCHDLCGAGVAFKLAWQIGREHCGGERLPQRLRHLLLDMLSLVALGTVADVVPLVGENRVLTMFGLGQIKRTSIPGLNAMIQAARLGDERVDAYHVGFVLGPRLNACGRMGHAREAVRLLTEADEAEARELAGFLTRENERRRTTEREIFHQACQRIEAEGGPAEDSRAIVVGGEDWHPGVVGIVASRLVERFSRPAVVLSLDNGEARGSARSVEGVSIYEAFEACGQHLEQFGGHAMAAGLTLPSDQVEVFRQSLVRFVNDRLGPEELRGLLEIDAELSLSECELDLFERIEALAPFGRGNPKPVLLVRNVEVAASPQLMGREGAHLGLTLRQGDTQRRAVAFGKGQWAERLPAGARVDVAFEPKISTWQGTARPELHVADLKFSS